MLTLKGPLYFGWNRLNLFGLVPFSLAATGPGSHAAGVQAHVLVLSVQQLQPECAQATTSHCYISIIDLLPIQLSWHQYPSGIYGCDGGYTLRGVFWNVGVGPGHTHTTILHVQQTGHLTDQLSRVICKLWDPRGRKRYLEIWFCETEKKK